MESTTGCEGTGVGVADAGGVPDGTGVGVGLGNGDGDGDGDVTAIDDDGTGELVTEIDGDALAAGTEAVAETGTEAAEMKVGVDLGSRDVPVDVAGVAARFGGTGAPGGDTGALLDEPQPSIVSATRRTATALVR